MTRGSESRTGGRNAESGRDGWRTFGEPSQTRQAESSVREKERGGRSNAPDSGSGWRRWNDATPAETRSNESGGGRSVESGSRRSESWVRSESPRGASRSEESVRIAPPIVRERNTRTYDEGFGRSSGMSGNTRSGGEFGGRRSESMSVPSIRGGGGEMRGSAPSVRSGGGEMRGGGGMTRSSGGGGGGARSGGGGSGRSGGGGGGRGR